MTNLDTTRLLVRQPPWTTLAVEEQTRRLLTTGPSNMMMVGEYSFFMDRDYSLPFFATLLALHYRSCHHVFIETRYP